MERIKIRMGPMTFDARADGSPDGDLVLLLHGFPQSSHEWRHQMPVLAEAGYRAVAPDQRGYSPGARPRDVDEYDLAFLVADVLTMADELGSPRFHLVGHDWGAAVAWALAGWHPDRVKSLTAVSVPHLDAFRVALTEGTGDQAQRSGYMEFFRSEAAETTFLADGAALLRQLYSSIPGEDADEYIALLTDDGGAGLTGGLNWYRANSFEEEQLGPVEVPTLYVWSTNDQALGREGAEATEQFVTGPYRFVVLEGVSHWVPEEAPADLNRELLAHLSQYS